MKSSIAIVVLVAAAGCFGFWIASSGDDSNSTDLGHRNAGNPDQNEHQPSGGGSGAGSHSEKITTSPYSDRVDDARRLPGEPLKAVEHLFDQRDRNYAYLAARYSGKQADDVVRELNTPEKLEVFRKVVADAIGRVQNERVVLLTHAAEILDARIEAGTHEMAKSGPPPRPVADEFVHYYETPEGRKCVRIFPGESEDVDTARARLRNVTARAGSEINAMLSLFRKNQFPNAEGKEKR